MYNGKIIKELLDRKNIPYGDLLRAIGMNRVEISTEEELKSLNITQLRNQLAHLREQLQFRDEMLKEKEERLREKEARIQLLEKLNDVISTKN